MANTEPALFPIICPANSVNAPMPGTIDYSRTLRLLGFAQILAVLGQCRSCQLFQPLDDPVCVDGSAHWHVMTGEVGF